VANIAGKSYGMTAFTPMSPLKTWGLRAALAAIHLGLFKTDQVKLRNLSFIHFARWVIIGRRQFPRLARTQPQEDLAYDYLLFESNFNGAWEQYIDAFSDVIPGGMDHIWMWSQKYPKSIPVNPFLDYIRANQIETTYYYNAYEDASTNDIKMALRFAREFQPIVAASARQTPNDFQRAYNALMTTIQTPPSGLDERTERPPSGLTILSPISPDDSTKHKIGNHTKAIRRLLLDLPTGSASPLARVDTTHLARWVVVDDVADEGYPAAEDHLKSAYLLFTSNFDGTLDAYLDAMVERIPEVVDGLWKHCAGYPGLQNRGAFKKYMRRCQVKTTFFFPAYPQATLAEVRRALALQRGFVDLFIANQGKPAAVQQQQFTLFANARQPGRAAAVS
jgi:hypothetical protein